MDIHHITPLILTYNEQPNIERTLSYLDWAKEIIVIDSYSQDGTLESLKNHPNAKVFLRNFDTHAQQWNYGIEKVESEWVLSLDADYSIPETLIEEIKTLLEDKNVDGYFIPFKYCVFGKPLRGTILPPRQALFRKVKASYIDDGHTQLLKVDGPSAQLAESIHHDDRKSLSRWLWAQDRYMVIETQKLLGTPWEMLSWGDRIRRTKVLAPPIIFLYCLIFKGGVWDGWAGLYYAFQRMLAEILLSIHLIEAERSLS